MYSPPPLPPPQFLLLDTFQDSPRFCIYQQCVYFYLWVAFHCLSISILLWSHYSHWLRHTGTHFGCFYFGAIMNKAATNLFGGRFVWPDTFVSLGRCTCVQNLNSVLLFFKQALCHTWVSNSGHLPPTPWWSVPWLHGLSQPGAPFTFVSEGHFLCIGNSSLEVIFFQHIYGIILLSLASTFAVEKELPT